MNQNVTGLMISVVFMFGTALHLKKREGYIVKTMVKPVLKVVSFSSLALFLVMAYILRNQVVSYLVAFSAGTFILSSIYSQGISEKGVHYFNGKTFVIPMEKWQDLNEAVLSDGEVLGIEFSGRRTRVNQTYHPEDREKLVGTLREKELEVTIKDE